MQLSLRLIAAEAVAELTENGSGVTRQPVMAGAVGDAAQLQFSGVYRTA